MYWLSEDRIQHTSSTGKAYKKLRRSNHAPITSLWLTVLLYEPSKFENTLHPPSHLEGLLNEPEPAAAVPYYAAHAQ